MNYKFVFVSIFVLFVCLLLYFIRFHYGLSNDSDDWANFGSYAGGISTLVLSFIVAYLTWYVYFANKNNVIRQKSMESISNSIATISDLFNEIESMTDNNGYNSKEKKRLERSINVQCDLILTYMMNLQKDHNFIVSVRNFKSNRTNDNFETMMKEYSHFLDNFTKNQLNIM